MTPHFKMKTQPPPCLPRLAVLSPSLNPALTFNFLKHVGERLMTHVTGSQIFPGTSCSVVVYLTITGLLVFTYLGNSDRLPNSHLLHTLFLNTIPWHSSPFPLGV